MPFNWSEKKSGGQPDAGKDPVAAAIPRTTPPALRIDAPAQALMERSGTVVQLPSLTIVPVDPELPPKLVRVRIEVHSKNEPLKEYVKRAYHAAINQVPGKLTKPVTIEPKPGEWAPQEPISASTEAHLLLRIEHLPTAKDGKPIGEKPVSVERNVRLLVGEGLRPTAVLRVTPPHLLKVYEAEDRGVGPRLTIQVRSETGAKRATAAELRQKTPAKIEVVLTAIDLKTTAAAWGCPGLEQSVERMLHGVQAALRQTETGAIIQHVPRFDLRPTEREALTTYLRQRNEQPLRLPVRVAASGAEPLVVLLELHPQGNIQEGLVVFDLGTSTSAAVRYDPTVVDGSAFPQEQLTQLRADLAELLGAPERDFIAEAESFWLRLLRQVCQACGIDGTSDPAKALVGRLTIAAESQSRADELYEVIRQIELHLWGLSGTVSGDDQLKLRRFQEKLSEKLYQIYARAFDKVPLGRWNIQLCRPTGETADFVGSELELVDLQPLACGILGQESAKHRQLWLAGKEPPPIGAIRQGRFIECPKQWLPHIHEEDDLSQRGLLPVTRFENGQEVEIQLTARQVLQAAWHSLVEAAIGPVQPGVPGIDHVAATYPADLMPEPRQSLDQALRELGMVNVYLDFDESVSPAVFHLEQLFGNMEEIGCEAFKVRCVKHDNVWTHHMLVLDIGAGTTDISLIRLEMRETLPDKTTYGGRVYEITPRLLGAAGRSRSGGHQLTLKLFRIMKRMLADWVRRTPAAVRVDAESTADTSQPTESSSADAIVFDGGPNDDNFKKALDQADSIIPTRYHNLKKHIHHRPGEEPSSADLASARQMLERFNTLWQWAEDLKIYLSELIERFADRPGEMPTMCRLDDACNTTLKDRMTRLLAGSEYASRLPDVLKTAVPFLKVSDFVELAQAAVEPSITLATGMARSALENFGNRPKVGAKLSLQSVVLSGRACNLPQVRERLKRELRQPTLGDGKAQILFRRDYAKSATAIGACRAQRRIANARDYAGPPDALEGKCEMDLRIENLFFYLPAAFQLGTASNDLGAYIFERHTEFTQFGRTPLGLIRSCGTAPVHASGGLSWSSLFTRPQRETMVYRNDGDGRGVLWGRLALQDLVANKVIGERHLPEEMATWRVRFEITHRQQLFALMLRPTTSARGEELAPIFDIGVPADDPQMIVELDRTKVLPLLGDKAATECPLHIYSAVPELGAQALVSVEEMQRIRCLGRPSVGKDGKPVAVVGWLGPSLDLEIHRDGVVTFYLVHAKTGKSVQTLHVTPRPKDPDNPLQHLLRFPFLTRYRTIITADGRFALVIGDEPRYWETEAVQEWLTNLEGQVLRKELKPSQQPEDWWTDPFCGQH
jgi:hypothetical protein